MPFETELKPVKARPSPVVAGMTSHDAFRALMSACLAHLIANRRGMLESPDPEYLHQTRVALRRLRSVFGTFKALFPAGELAPLIEETRWLARALGPARDWDVFNDETLPPVIARYEGHAGIAAMARSAARLRVAANRRARRAVVSARGQGLLLAFGDWLNAGAPARSKQGSRLRDATTEPTVSASVIPDPVPPPDGAPALAASERQRLATDFAREVLEAALKRVAKRGRHLGGLAPRELHRLRIAAKKLRYAVEFFAPLYDDARAGAYRAALVRLQDALGSYNDAVTVKQLAVRANRGLQGVVADEAFGIMLNWSADMRETGARNLQRGWKKFRAARAFWE
jgi:triphosphatase